MTLYSVLSVPNGDTDLYGKKASDLGSFSFAKTGMVTGNANYVTGYTGFNPAKESEQEGYYLPITFTPSSDVKEAYMHVVGSNNKPVKMDAGNVVFIGKSEDIAKEKEVEITSGSDRFILKMSGLKFSK